MTLAVLFPGQGSDLASVIGEWHASSVAVQSLLARVSERTGVPVSRLVHGSGVALRDSRVYQPALVALCVGALRELEARGVAPGIVAGHSLGELAACASVGALSHDAAVELAAVRGALMSREAERHPGAMVALRTTPQGAQEAFAIAAAHGAVSIAAFNAPDEQVLSGAREALREVPARFTPTFLVTAGAWHSLAMQGAVMEFAEACARACGALASVVWIPNRTGVPAAPSADVASLLSAQLVQPVQWQRTMESLRDHGVHHIITLGPARALRSLVTRTLGSAVDVVSVERPSDLQRATEALTS